MSKSIPVRLLRFNRPVDVPGKSVAESLKGSPEPSGRERHRIEYMPWLRHHRIEYHPPAPAATVVMLVHETWCAWEPWDQAIDAIQSPGQSSARK